MRQWDVTLESRYSYPLRRILKLRGNVAPAKGAGNYKEVFYVSIFRFI